MFHGLATLLSQPSPTSTVSRSTLSLNKERRPHAAPNQQLQQQHHQQQQQQLHFQERLVDWDRPATSVGAANRINSNSSPSLAAEMASTGGVSGAMHQRHMTSLGNANSKSVPALHSEGQEVSGAFQQQPPAGTGTAEMMYPPQQHPQARVMANQRTMSAQHLPQQIQQQQQRMAMPQQLAYSAGMEPTSPTSRLAPPLQQQQQLPPPATRSRSVQNLSEVQQQVNNSQQRASLRARHPSNPSVDEERQYQNIALYQQQMVAQQQQQQQQQQVAYPKAASTTRGLLSPVNRTAHLRAPSSIGQQSESPPPPPPPPTSTHPLLANQNNPWEREEKEREVLRRQEAARIWMEEQIAELEALGQQRSPKQEEQLRTLRLEMEFRKRAQEAAKDEEEEVPFFLCFSNAR